MDITKVAKKYNISLRTLRYYEELKILEPTRLDNNTRDYNQSQLDRIELILILKSLNLKLNDIKTILSSNTNKELKEVLELELSNVEESITDLVLKRQLLRSLLNTYGSSNITKHNIQEFVNEQLYFTTKSERLMKMFTSTENITLEIGESLISTATTEDIPSLLTRIKELRNTLSESHGIEMDKVRVKDNIDDLNPFEYQIIQNNEVIIRKNISSKSISSQIDDMITNLKTLILNSDI